jgi:hypothetical protein
VALSTNDRALSSNVLGKVVPKMVTIDEEGDDVVMIIVLLVFCGEIEDQRLIRCWSLYIEQLK